ncbi:protein of unknown function [Candidatus Methylomirabilis oxygeniifera]|uniref:Uncharacterized protein n=1 Tax=Methylomirabilis oxygeniifera TaxID=671143 RepID=D5MIX9_METO1|nr:protein of unknown function [Candidatus Methylomirabilis oxyfera]
MPLVPWHLEHFDSKFDCPLTALFVSAPDAEEAPTTNNITITPNHWQRSRDRKKTRIVIALLSSKGVTCACIVLSLVYTWLVR